MCWEVISPMDGIGPSDLEIESLVNRVKEGTVKEVILALSSTMEGDTTNFYIFRKLASCDVKITVIARGISIGDELQYTDEVTLGRSIVNRVAFTEPFKDRKKWKKNDSSAPCAGSGICLVLDTGRGRVCVV